MKVLFFFLLSFPLWAIPENDYESVWKREVLAPLDSVPAKEFTGPRGLMIRYRVYHRGEGLPNIVVSPGRTEPMKKYFELVHDLPNANFYLIDHPGQGESDRYLENRDKGYVRDAQDYVDAFTFWMENFVIPETQGSPLYLIAHSMGAAIATRFSETHPQAFDRMVLNAPMFAISTKPYPTPAAKLMARLIVGARQGTKYAPGRGPYDPEKDTPDTNEFTKSLARIEMNKFLYLEHDIGVGGPTSRWVHEAFRLMKGITRVGEKLEQPILLLQSGKDTTVLPKSQVKFCHLAKNCQLVRIEGAWHEILQEKDEYRNEALRLIRKHLDL